jgi:2'-5' RNA ligase
MKPGDRLITALVGEHREGETFKDWLLHVTIVAWFESDLSSEEIARKLQEQLQGIKPFEVTMAGEEHLGFGGKALVNLVAQPTPFMEIQKRVEKTLDELGVKMTATRGTWGEAYKPHVTVQGAERLHEGDAWHCDRLYVVSQLGHEHRIEAVVPLA